MRWDRSEELPSSWDQMQMPDTLPEDSLGMALDKPLPAASAASAQSDSGIEMASSPLTRIL